MSKIAAYLLILGLSSSPALAQLDTGEVTLIEGILALSGERLPADAWKSRMAELLDNYDRESPSEGRLERYVDAMTGLGLLSPERAPDFRAELERVASQDGPLPARRIQELSQEYVRDPSGHQYTRAEICSTVVWGSFGTALGGVAVAIINPRVAGPIFGAALGTWFIGATVGQIIAGPAGDCL